MFILHIMHVVHAHALCYWSKVILSKTNPTSNTRTVDSQATIHFCQLDGDISVNKPVLTEKNPWMYNKLFQRHTGTHSASLLCSIYTVCWRWDEAREQKESRPEVKPGTFIQWDSANHRTSQKRFDSSLISNPETIIQNHTMYLKEGNKMHWTLTEHTHRQGNMSNSGCREKVTGEFRSN